MEISEVVKQIQLVLAPAVMISSSALLLLGFQNKFSNLASRFRMLNHEKRLLALKERRNETEETRLQSLTAQVAHLMQRSAHMKNAILSAYAAILGFAGASILIFTGIYTSIPVWRAAVGIFLAGFLCIFYAAVCLIRETVLFYRIVKIEYEA